MQQEAVWANMLKQTTLSRQARKHAFFDETTRTQQLSTITKKMVAAAKNSSFETTKHYYTEAVQILAEIAIYNLQELRSCKAEEKQAKSLAIQQTYHQKCLQLAIATDHILGIDQSL